MTANRWMGIGALLMASSIIAGAFGAHFLRLRLDPYLLTVYEKAVFYQIVNSLGMVLLGTVALLTESKALLRPIFLLALGVVVFCGSLYCLSLTGVRWIGAITPIGGVAFIVGWCWAGLVMLKK